MEAKYKSFPLVRIVWNLPALANSTASLANLVYEPSLIVTPATLSITPFATVTDSTPSANHLASISSACSNHSNLSFSSKYAIYSVSVIVLAPSCIL